MYYKLRNLMKQKGLKPADVSKMAGISPSTLSDWKSGKSKPKLDKLQKIAKALGVPITYFLEEEGNGQQNAGL